MYLISIRNRRNVSPAQGVMNVNKYFDRAFIVDYYYPFGLFELCHRVEKKQTTHFYLVYLIKMADP